MNLPWLNHRKHNAEIAESTARATEQDAEVAALRNAAFGQVQEALIQAQALQKFMLLYRDQPQPQAEATLQSSVTAYQNDRKPTLLDCLIARSTLSIPFLPGRRRWPTSTCASPTRTRHRHSLEKAETTTVEVKP